MSKHFILLGPSFEKYLEHEATAPNLDMGQTLRVDDQKEQT